MCEHPALFPPGVVLNDLSKVPLLYTAKTFYNCSAQISALLWMGFFLFFQPEHTSDGLNQLSVL